MYHERLDLQTSRVLPASNSKGRKDQIAIDLARHLLKYLIPLCITPLRLVFVVGMPQLGHNIVVRLLT